MKRRKDPQTINNQENLVEVVEKDTVPAVIYKGMYFITICTYMRQPIFGKIVGAGLAPAQMELSEIGMIAYKQWIEIPKRFDNIELDEFVIMPHHIHGIIVICNPNQVSVNRKGCPYEKSWGKSLVRINLL